MAPNILAIDPGSEKGIGFALIRGDDLALCGSGVMFTQRPDPNSPEGKRRDRTMVWSAILNILEHWAPLCDVIAYEDVVKHSSVWSAHLYGGQIAHLQWYAHCHSKQFCPVPVQTAKRALGSKASGKAKLTEQVKAAHRLGYTSVKDSNEADAVGIALGALWMILTSESQPCGLH